MRLEVDQAEIQGVVLPLRIFFKRGGEVSYSSLCPPHTGFNLAPEINSRRRFFIGMRRRLVDSRQSLGKALLRQLGQGQVIVAFEHSGVVSDATAEGAHSFWKPSLPGEGDSGLQKDAGTRMGLVGKFIEAFRRGWTGRLRERSMRPTPGYGIRCRPPRLGRH